MSLGATGALEQAALLALYDRQPRARGSRRDGAPATRRDVLQALAALAQTHETDGAQGLRFLLEPSASPLLRGPAPAASSSASPGRASSTYSPLAATPSARARSWPSARRSRSACGSTGRAWWSRLDARLPRPRSRAPARTARDFASPATPRPDDEPALRRRSARSRVTGDVRRPPAARCGPRDVRSWRCALARAVGEALGRAELEAALRWRAGLERPRAAAGSRAAAKDLAAQPRRRWCWSGRGSRRRCTRSPTRSTRRSGPRGVEVTRARRCDEPRSRPRVAAARCCAEIARGSGRHAGRHRLEPGLHRARRPRPRRGARAGAAHRLLARSTRTRPPRRCARWSFPAAHSLERWGDARAFDGTASHRPAADPPALRGRDRGRRARAVRRARRAPPRTSCSRRSGASAVSAAEDFQQQWEDWLAHGVDPRHAASRRVAPPCAGRRPISRGVAAPPPARGLELHFVPDCKVYDGRFANNPWLQELPDPVTKLTWDNAALLSPATAKRLGLERGDVVELRAAASARIERRWRSCCQATPTTCVTLAARLRRASPAERDGARRRASTPTRCGTRGRAWSGERRRSRAGGKARLAITQHHWRWRAGRSRSSVTLPRAAARTRDALESSAAPPEHLYSPQA